MEIMIGNGLMTAKVNTHGGELKSLRSKAGNEYIWDGSEYWKRSAPLLFPIVGGLEDGEVEIEGKIFHMGQHGFARDKDWTVTENTGDSVTLTLTDDEDTHEKYPYPFLLSVRYALVNKSVEMTFTVKNTGTGEMVYCFGTHPAIRCPFESAPGTEFEGYRVEFEKDEIPTQPTLTAEKIIDRSARSSFMKDARTLLPRYDVFTAIDTVIFDEIHSHKIKLTEPVSGKYFEVRFDDFTQLGIWTPKAGAPFLCIEPWNGCAAIKGDGKKFTDKLGARALLPGKEKSFTLILDAEHAE